MNRNQYFATSWFFMALAIFLICLHTTLFLSVYDVLNSGSLIPYDIYYNMKWALVAVVITLCFPLFILFQILGWLEPKKKH